MRKTSKLPAGAFECECGTWDGVEQQTEGQTAVGRYLFRLDVPTRSRGTYVCLFLPLAAEAARLCRGEDKNGKDGRNDKTTLAGWVLTAKGKGKM